MRHRGHMTHFSKIESVQNSMVKHAYSLKVPKKAKESVDFLCEGFHLALEALVSGLRCRFIFATKGGWEHPDGQRIHLEAQKAKVKCFEVTSKIVSYLADTVTPEGVFVVVEKPQPAWPSPPFSKILAVYQVQDPGNMGTLFRSAEAFGAQGIFLTEGCCDLFNPKAVRASMGSLFRLPFRAGETWKSYMEWLDQNGFHSYALTMKVSKPIPMVRFSTPMSIWVGAEGSGLPDDLAAACEERVRIPMAGKVESLNVGVAASLALYFAQSQGPVS